MFDFQLPLNNRANCLPSPEDFKFTVVINKSLLVHCKFLKQLSNMPHFQATKLLPDNSSPM